MERSHALAYDCCLDTLDQEDGRVPVSIPVIDADGNPAMLTISYSVDGFDSEEDWEETDAINMIIAQVAMMNMSRATAREHGAIPLDEAY